MLKLACGVCVTFLFLVTSVSAGNNKQSANKGIQFHQTDYVINFERVQVDHYNKDVLKYFKIVTFKYNRTIAAINVSITFRIDIGYDYHIITLAYKFASNEYRLFPIRFGINFCESLTQNVLGTGEFTKCGNFTGCPIMKDKPYFVCNWTPDYSKSPPFIPNGSYMLEFQAMHHSTEMYVIHAYGTVTRPIPWF